MLSQARDEAFGTYWSALLSTHVCTLYSIVLSWVHENQSVLSVLVLYPSATTSFLRPLRNELVGNTRANSSHGVPVGRS